MFKLIPRFLINFLDKNLPVFLIYYVKFFLRKIRLLGDNLYSSEISYINLMINRAIGKKSDLFFLDIGASDGISNSNTYHLLERKWSGLMVEGSYEKFRVLNKSLRHSNVKSINEFVFSSNIIDVLNVSGCPKAFDFLSLDIDSFEYSVLNKILMHFKPYLICVEINERFPPPIVFHIKEGIDASLIKDAFYGFSIQAAYNVLKTHGYKVVGLHYNNVYAVPFASIIPEVNIFQCYKYGYVNAINRKKFFYWNKPYDFLLEMKPQQIIDYYDSHFSGLKGYYSMYIN